MARFPVLARYFGLKREGGDIRSQGLNSFAGVKRTGTVPVPYFFKLLKFCILGDHMYLQLLRAHIHLK